MSKVVFCKESSDIAHRLNIYKYEDGKRLLVAKWVHEDDVEDVLSSLRASVENDEEE